MQNLKALLYPRKELFVIMLLVILITLFHFPLLQRIKTSVPSLDWYGIYAFPSFFRLSILEYRQFPLRAPHFVGGYPLIGHPYDQSLNPLSIIVLLFGAIAGTKIIVFLIFLISSLSVFYLTRYELRYNLLGSFFSSATFAFSSWGACQYLESNYEKLYIYLLPLILISFIKSVKNKKFIFLTSLLLSIIILSGGAILLPVILFIFLFACTNFVYITKWREVKLNSRYLTTFLVVVLLAFLLCMVKILPMLNLYSNEGMKFIHFAHEHDYSQVSKTIIEEKRALNPRRLYQMLFMKDSYIVGTEGDDYLQIHLGYIPFLFAGLSFLFWWRKTLRYLLILIIFILLSFGPYSCVDLFKWLWHLNPLVHSIWRVDEFFTFPILLILSIVSGMLFVLYDQRKSRTFLLLLITVAIFSLNNMFWPNRRFFNNKVTEEISNFTFQKQFYQVKINDPLADEEHYQKDGYFYLQQNVGMADWLFTNLKIKSTIIPKYLIKLGDYRYLSNAPGNLELNPFYKGEVFFLNQENDAQLRYFSPNEIHVDVKMKDAGTLIINQNYHAAWRTNAGSLLNHNGLLAISLDKTGSYIVRLTYVPFDFYLGMIISASSLLISYHLFIYKKTFSRGG